MMMGVGILFMALVGLIVIGVPLLIAALIAGGGLRALFNSQSRQAGSDHPSSSHEPAGERKCPTCGRAVRPDWNVCPTCGAALT